MSERFPGCHGIAISPESLGLELGWLAERPPLGVEVELAASVERDPAAELVWQLDEPPSLGLPLITSQTWEEPSGSTWFGNTLNLALRVDHAAGKVTIAAKNDNRQVVLEALASVALPLVAQEGGALVLHGSAASLGGSATMLCAASGSGKSSLLMGLAAAGWAALSEDQCVIDLDADDRHRLWPGPSWARLKQGAPIPSLIAGEPPRFEALDKVAWSLDPWLAREPARLERIVLLEPPGGDELVLEPVPEAELIGALAGHATWLRRDDAFALAVLPAIVKLGMSVPGFRMRAPRRPDWLEHGVALLTEG